MLIPNQVNVNDPNRNPPSYTGIASFKKSSSPISLRLRMRRQVQMFEYLKGILIFRRGAINGDDFRNSKVQYMLKQWARHICCRFSIFKTFISQLIHMEEQGQPFWAHLTPAQKQLSKIFLQVVCVLAHVEIIPQGMELSIKIVDAIAHLTP